MRLFKGTSVERQLHTLYIKERSFIWEVPYLKRKGEADRIIIKTNIESPNN
jgi:hypothetical protein